MTKPSAIHPGDVPLIGGKNFVNVCGRGHAEAAPGPFTFDVPLADGRLMRVPCCRMCVAQFFSTWFNVQTVSRLEFEANGGQLNDGGLAEKIDGGGKVDGQA